MIDWGLYCYKVIPFGLKKSKGYISKAGEQIVHKPNRKMMEVYINNMLVKSFQAGDHLKY